MELDQKLTLIELDQKLSSTKVKTHLYQMCASA